jgi:hypothetical protein
MLSLDEYRRKDVGHRMEEHFELQPAQPCHVGTTQHVTRLLDVSFRGIPSLAQDCCSVWIEKPYSV